MANTDATIHLSYSGPSVARICGAPLTASAWHLTTCRPEHFADARLCPTCLAILREDEEADNGSL